MHRLFALNPFYKKTITSCKNVHFFQFRTYLITSCNNSVFRSLPNPTTTPLRHKF